MKLDIIKTDFDCPRTCPQFEARDYCRFNALLAKIGVERVVNSHVVSCDVKFKSLPAIEATARALGLDVVIKSEYRWYGRHVGDYPVPDGFDKTQLGKCDFALSVKGDANAYEAGMVQTGDSFTMLFDFWGSQGKALQDVIGENGQTFAAEYAMQSAELAANQLGWMSQRQTNDNGADVLRVFHPTGGYLDVDSANGVEAFNFNGVGCHDAAMELANAIGTPTQATAKQEFANVELQNHVAQ